MRWKLIICGVFVLVLASSVYGGTYNEDCAGKANGTNINSCCMLQGMNSDLTADYTLVNNIDCSNTSLWNSGSGFLPVGVTFTGNFKGENYNITDLYINDNSTGIVDVGMFERMTNNVVANFTFVRPILISASTNANSFKGMLSGQAVTNVLVENVNTYDQYINASRNVGGLIARGAGGQLLITDSLSTNLHIDSFLNQAVYGSIVGDRATVNRSGAINFTMNDGRTNTGGICGKQCVVDQSFAHINITSSSLDSGGIVGADGKVTNSYATGVIYPEGFEGQAGIIGEMATGNYIINCWANITIGPTGPVWGGGLAGHLLSGTMSINDSFALSTTIENDILIGGIVGDSTGATLNIGNTYWNNFSTDGIDACSGTPNDNPSGCIAIDDNEAYFKGTSAVEPMASWDFTNIWATQDGDFPCLRWEEGCGDAPSPASSISIVFLEALALNSSGSSTNIGFNSGNLSAIETVKLRYNISATSANISSFYLNFTAGGTNGCSLGNLQGTTCYNISNPISSRWIQVINNTLTSTYDATSSGGNQGDRILFTIENISDSNWILNITIDEHYNPNIKKRYEARYDFSDVKWQTGTDQRITGNTYIRINWSGVVIPLNADQYKLDERLNYTTGSFLPSQPLEYWACNSSTESGDPASQTGCVLVAEKLPSEFQDDGTKFRGIFTKQLIDELGDIGYIILKSNEPNPNKYYYLKTYKATAGSYTTTWEYSTDSGTTYTNLGDGYEHEQNFNYFYNGGVNPTQFIYNFWANNSAGDVANITNITTWTINANQSYNPLVSILTPVDGSTITTTYVNITWVATDPNDDELNITIYLDDVVQISNLNQSNASQYNVTTTQGTHNVTVRVEKLNNSGFYIEDTHSFTITLGTFNFSIKDYGIEWITLNWSGGTNEVADISTDNLTWTSLTVASDEATATALQSDTLYYFRVKDDSTNFGYLTQTTKSGGINEMEIALSLFAITFMVLAYKLWFNNEKEED